MRHTTARRRARSPRLGAILALIAFAALAAAADPARAQWRVDSDLGYPVAVSGPVGPMAWVAFFCTPEEGLFLTTRFSEAVPDAVPVVFTFRYVRYVVPFRRIVAGEDILYADLEAIGDLRAALGGRASSVRIGLDDRPLGVLSLRGSTSAIRDATGGCEPGMPPSPAVVARLEATADAIDPNAAAVRAAVVAEAAAEMAARAGEASAGGPSPPAAVDVDKKATLPAVVQAAVDEIRAICDTPGAAMRFGPGGLMRTDINGDGAPDYMISAYGIECPAGRLLCGASVCDVRVFASRPSGDYEAAGVMLGDWYTFDSNGLSAPCEDPNRKFRIAWRDGGLRTTYCR